MKSNKENFDAIIIGSGIGGLVTASQLAAKGADVLVLEKYIIPGGSGGSFKRNGYTFDVGASMIFGFGDKGYTNLLTRALKDVNEKCETIPDPVQLEYHLPNNFNISVNKNYDQFINKLSARFPKEKEGIKNFYDTCASVFKCLDSMPLLSIEDPSYLFKVFFKSPLSCLGLARWLPVNAGDVARKFIKDPELLKFIDIECFCWSVMPAIKTPMINAGMVFTDRHAGGINYPKGGVGTIAEKLVSGIEKFGSKIRYKANVVEILLKDEKAVGVKLSNGEEIYSDIIVSNSTRWDTFGLKDKKKGLIASKDVPKSEYKWSETYKSSPSFVSIHLGVKKNLISNNFNCHHIIVENWDELESEKGVIFVSIPTLLDSSLAPEGKHIVHAFTPSSMSEWEGLSRKEYLQKKEKYFSFIVERISQILPNLEENIDHKEIGTPKTHKKFLGRYEGSYGPIPRQKLLGLLPMPFNTTKIKNLYCVGDSCFPGQGLNAVAFSGYACAHKIGSKLNINSFNLPD
ncbi:carotenoid isomerase [Prochlorococcus marinus]|uniref:carotenoid isomerase n=1 Tax=Prochlorococcus marinus TaxID=1219 RepID=UPI001AD9CBC4|nr:carotenoid isomerase [Prochlorococcus marinus]MBO8217479.1 carotene isomerase [Prochlorococcus marinus XMU1405]MBW3040694.1 carotene isomerase [Prochlorococcus marinus str. MU1405]MBW3048151.1 carotene isomerase [Prochlorococcus marinus str. MU1406]